MWLLQPAQGRTAIRKVWRDWLRSVPDYQMDVIDIASDTATNDAFVMWRASGMAKLSLIPQRPTTNKPFEHSGVTRSAAPGSMQHHIKAVHISAWQQQQQRQLYSEEQYTTDAGSLAAQLHLAAHLNLLSFWTICHLQPLAHTFFWQQLPVCSCLMTALSCHAAADGQAAL